ncbi:MAG: ATP-binding cassette domain-containing protein, partial [Bacilli bacterium]|nr:ATP-binding cassette domain-containing protein [Bacilli bacterium]
MDIKLEKISLKDKKNVLENIDLEVISGTITVLLSNNYKKLKALLSILSINQTPTSGDIFLNGQKIKDFNNQKQNIGFCPNTIHFKHKTINEDLETILESKRKKINEKRIEDTLKMVGLTQKYLLKNPNELSSGEKQKLSIAT